MTHSFGAQSDAFSLAHHGSTQIHARLAKEDAYIAQQAALAEPDEVAEAVEELSAERRHLAGQLQATCAARADVDARMRAFVDLRFPGGQVPLSVAHAAQLLLEDNALSTDELAERAAALPSAQ